MSIKLLYKFILIILLGTFPVIASDKEEEQYKLIEKIITEGKIIHKKSRSYYDNAGSIPSNVRNGNPETFWDLQSKNYTLDFLINYKTQLYNCSYSSKESFNFSNRAGWYCYHIFEIEK